MKRIFIFFLLTMPFFYIQAQTWTGSSSRDWNTPGNWSPAGIPGSPGNVIIPGSVSSGNWPKFSGNVTINSIDLQPGSQLDVNGFSLTLNGVDNFIKFIGTTLNNSSGSTDIEMNINTGTGGFYTFFSRNTVNDSIVFNITGTNQFVEGYDGAPNHYNGNVRFNINDQLTALISYLVPSQYHCNLGIFRTVAGGTSLFNASATITGDFSYSNLVGTGTGIGNQGIETIIGGLIDIDVNYLVPGGFEMYQVHNKKTGGSIIVKNSQGFVFKNDTLAVNSLGITGYKTGQYGDLFSNKISGNVNIANDISYGGGFITRIRNNVIIGNTIYSNNGSNPLIEADAVGTGNSYTGNVTFNASGGPVYIGYSAPVQCSGNLVINRTATGHTQAFTSGGTIGGNFTYTNQTAGPTLLGNETVPTSIAGTINISTSNTDPGIFQMIRINNQTLGGSINVIHPGGFNVVNNTLMVNQLSLTGYHGATNNYFSRNNVTGNVTIADDAGYTGGFYTYIQSNSITGNTEFANNGSNTFIEADVAGTGNTYTGNVSFNASGGSMFIAKGAAIHCSGNLTILCNPSVQLQAFGSGGFIGGHLVYTRNN
jgi:hypothetical protein